MAKRLEIEYGKSYGNALFYAARNHHYEGDFLIGFNLPGKRAGRYLNFHSGRAARKKFKSIRKKFLAAHQDNVYE